MSQNLSSQQEKAYDLILSRDGITQSELWKALDANSRAGSRLAKALAEKGLIEREEVVENGRTTYLLKPVDNEGETTTEPDSPQPSKPENPTPDQDDERESREERALSLIREHNGIYQSDFWKELGVDSRTGSRIATNLEEKGLIQREETTYNGQRTYFLKPPKKDLDFSLLMAGDEISPMIGSDEVDPIESPAFSQWVMNLAREE